MLSDKMDEILIVKDSKKKKKCINHITAASFSPVQHVMVAWEWQWETADPAPFLGKKIHQSGPLKLTY